MTRKTDSKEPLILISHDDDEEKLAGRIAAALGVEIATGFGERNETPLAIGAYDGETLIGGLAGVTHWGWLYIRHVWIETHFRGRGIGQSLLADAELEARRRGCGGLYLDTFDPRAAKFYERAGFIRFGRIDGFPPGHARLFLSKKLV
ncbi:GCN5-related N-acetyltransferase [Methylocella silvestris BL2]|uniref:GCN5-related N-acetyltransferase n=1 Tax=Methylocella silvestris (strain DSM 15510 / CIP 108128 / LMG 27833 / NCIMB 13906 / BL2) TaxID=395965 RepID=B8EIC7_METSB|nr:GNAT family N-acetyltransferase [Methylocella silvestris]ACK51246.1 GCN5-related N-acetyltransferase [Methylocella silvestris BL2]